MKKLIALFASLALLVPAFAMAEPGPGLNSGPGSLRANVRAEIEDSGSNRGPGSNNSGPGKLGPMIKDLASTTRAELKARAAGTASTTRDIIKRKLDALHDLVEQHKGEMRERAEAARVNARERFGEHIEALVDNVSSRLASSSERLAGIAARIGGRIDTLESEGHDLSGSAALLATAQADLSLADDKIAAVNQALADAMAMGTTTAKAAIPAVRTAVRAAEDALKLVKEDLQKTLRSIKVETGAEASTTTSI